MEDTFPAFKCLYLDKGYVELIDCLGSDRSIAEAAWVSSDRSEDRTDEDVARVVRYMARHNHWTPFGQTALRFRFRVPIFVARQLMRSNVGIVWNEESRRYVDSEPEFYVPSRWRKRSKSMKQGSGGVFTGSVRPVGWGATSPSIALREIQGRALDIYTAMIDAGVAPEQARIVLPQSTYTTIVGTFNLASLSRVYKLRSDSHAQQEIQELAACIDVCVRMTGSFKVSWRALIEEKG